MSSDESEGDSVGFVMTEESILMGLSNRGFSAGFESEVSRALRSPEAPGLAVIFSRIFSRMTETVRKISAAEAAQAEAVSQVRKIQGAEKTWKKEVAVFKEKFEAAENSVEKIRQDSRVKIERLKNENGSLEEEISRFKTRENLLQREIEILIKSMKSKKPEPPTLPEPAPEELIDSVDFRETLSENFPIFEIKEELGLSPSTILRGL